MPIVPRLLPLEAVSTEHVAQVEIARRPEDVLAEPQRVMRAVRTGAGNHQVASAVGHQQHTPNARGLIQHLEHRFAIIRFQAAERRIGAGLVDNADAERRTQFARHIGKPPADPLGRRRRTVNQVGRFIPPTHG
ncbi:hypothetical protein D9M68_790780 [compost metagenome]